MKAIFSKCHFLLSPYQHTSININGSVISSNCERIIGISIDSDSTFEEHVNTLSQKLAKNCMRFLEFHNFITA